MACTPKVHTPQCNVTSPDCNVTSISQSLRRGEALIQHTADTSALKPDALTCPYSLPLFLPRFDSSTQHAQHWYIDT
eukprot:37177-Eustigmatos_ZCMA.PRE.1